MILYKLHVRGYTKANRNVKGVKGTFQVLEEMIPYWKELGINAIELMPAYEFMEISRQKEPEGLVSTKGKKDEVNYWGYGNGLYFAPKRSYCATKDPHREFCDMIKAFHKAGNRVIVVLAARTKDLVILEEQMRQNSDEVIIMTDDGSYGTKGLVTNGVESVINRERVDLCVTIGPAIMMKFVSALTKKYEIPTVASLNTIMVDGTGMCGACRITVGGKTKFVCVDGPEFDAHQVDFDEMIMRLGAYKDIEKK